MALYDNFDDYVKENDAITEESDNANYYTSKFQDRLNGNSSVKKVIDELFKIMYANNITGELRNDLINIVDSFPMDGKPEDLEKQLNDYMSTYSETLEGSKKKSDEEINDIKEDFVQEEIIKPLEDAGVKINGDIDTDNIKSEEDMYKLEDNVANTVDYFNEQSQYVNEDDSPTLELDSNVINDVLDKTSDTTILDASLEQQENTLVDTDTSLIDAKDDGSIEITGDSMNPDSINYMAMMTAMLVASNTAISLGSNLDMKIIKNYQDVTKFKASFGNFPLKDHPENKLDPVLVSKIMEQAKNYNPSINYLDDVISINNPELSEVIRMVDTHLLNRKGAFQIGVRNGGQSNEIAFGLDENYSDIKAVFNKNGVSSNITNGNKMIVPNTVPGEQLNTLSNINQDLSLSKNNSKNNNYQIIKKMEPPKPEQELAQAGNAGGTFLLTTVVASLLMLGAYAVMIFTR